MYYDGKIEPEQKMASGFDVPPAQTASQTVTGALKEETALLPVDDDGIAVQQGTAASGTESTNLINCEMASVRPEDGAGLHITGGIKVRSDLDVQMIGHRHPIFQFRIHNSEFIIIGLPENKPKV